jgi:hypothetical protein
MQAPEQLVEQIQGAVIPAALTTGRRVDVVEGELTSGLVEIVAEAPAKLGTRTA